MQGKLLSNRYLLAEEIGNGGMGSVFLATDLRTGGQVAVKIPHPFLARDPIYTERLKREAKIAARLYSPRIVRVMDLDADEGLPFLVMEFVPGETLADELRTRGRLPVVEALTVALETARALEAAHQNGVVHRDLKPQNIKLVEGEIKVLDFGIARDPGSPGVTIGQVFLGTPEYAAPERAEAMGDIRSDIYSVGIMLYEMLAGHLPFSGLTPIAVLRKHEREPPPPLPQDIPEDAAAIVLRCLAKQPEDRYATPRDLAQAITAVLRTMPLPAPLPAGRHPDHGIAPPDLSTDPPTAPAEPPPTAVFDLDGTGVGTPAAEGRFLATTPIDGSVGAGAETAVEPPAAATVPMTGPVRRLRTVDFKLRTPHQRALLAGTGFAATLGIALMATLLIAGGGSDAGQVEARVPPAAAPATAPTAEATTAVVLATVPATPAATPPRPMVVDEIPLERAANTEERNLIRTLNEANRAEVLAYRRADITGLEAYFVSQALKEVVNNIGGLKRLGRYGIADLKSVTLLRLVLESGDRATMETREVQDYDEMVSGTNEAVPDQGLHRKDQVLRWTYQLVKLDSRWLIENKNFSLEQ
jgi:serine/threonine-protein kinase